MRILVTGGAGFIGAHLVKKLIDLNHKVLVVDNLKVIGGISFVHPKCKFIKGDILNSKTLKQIEKVATKNYLSHSCPIRWRKRL